MEETDELFLRWEVLRGEGEAGGKEGGERGGVVQRSHNAR